MRINRTGKICDDLYVLGSREIPSYLLDGEVPVLFEAGLTCLAKLYEQEIRNILGQRRPEYLFLTHSHFDHIGSASYLKKVWPQMKIAASSRFKDVLARPNALKLIAKLNQVALKTARQWGLDPLYEGPFEAFQLDIPLDGNRKLQLGKDSVIEALNTPGHTWDFTSYWIPQKKILVSSESLGADEGHGEIGTEFLVDYDVYRDSMERLAALDAEVLCPGHRAVLTGEDVKDHIGRSMSQASEYVSMVEKILEEENGDVESTVSRVKAVEWEPRPLPKQPEEAYLLNTRVRVKSLLERMNRR